MFSIKNWLTSLLLVAAISCPTFASAPVEPNSNPIPVVAKQETKKSEEKTFSDHFKIFENEVAKEADRRGDRLKNLEEWGLMQSYIARRSYDFCSESARVQAQTASPVAAGKLLGSSNPTPDKKLPDSRLSDSICSI